jgi:hypothetical protein
MNLHLSPTTTRISKRPWDRRALAVGATVLGLTLVVGAATWQSAGRHEQASTGGVLSQPATATLSQDGARSPSATQAGGGQIVYIVRSEEQAAFMREFIAEAGKIQVASGQRPSLTADVLVSDMDADRLTEALHRTVGAVFVDLRTP